jgi:hypothetical protein
VEHELQLRRAMTIVFAILSGASAVSVAILPAVLQL